MSLRYHMLCNENSAPSVVAPSTSWVHDYIYCSRHHMHSCNLDSIIRSLLVLHMDGSHESFVENVDDVLDNEN